MARPVHPNPHAINAFPAREQPPLTWDCRGGIAPEGQMTEEQKLAAIVAAVAADQGVPAEAIRGRRRTREVLQARHLATALAYEFLPALTVPEIAQLMNKTQHSTVANSLRVCRKPKEAEMYARLREVLAGYIGLPQ